MHDATQQNLNCLWISLIFNVIVFYVQDSDSNRLF